VATDAIGMGLNLNIRRVIFSSLLKFDGKETRALTPSQVSSKLDGKFFMVLIFII